MKIYLNILVLCLMLFSSKETVAQKDSIAQQRKARKMVRQGNKLYEQKQFTDASVAYQKALGNNSNYDKASYNLGNALYQNKNFKEAKDFVDSLPKAVKEALPMSEAEEVKKQLEEAGATAEIK